MMGEKGLWLSHFVSKTTVLGPGIRFVIWTQGCDKKCENCVNPQGQTKDGGTYYSVDQLLSEIIDQKEINGITVSGGEPFLQYESLCDFVRRIKVETQLDIMVYTGYYLEELISKHGKKIYDECLKWIDILVDGPYEEKLDSGTIYRGSDNQKFYFFTDKYLAYETQMIETKNRNIEFVLNSQSEVYMVGIPEKNFFAKYVNEMRGKFL